MYLKYLRGFLALYATVSLKNIVTADSVLGDIIMDNMNNTKIPHHKEKKTTTVIHFDEHRRGATYDHTGAWAELRNVTQTLPEDFTICSATARQTGSHYQDQVFFMFLGENDQHFLSAFAGTSGQKTSLYYTVGEEQYHTSKSIPFRFPSEWIHSCMAVSMASVNQLQIVWVVDGTMVENKTLQMEGNSARMFPSKILLGVRYNPNQWKFLGLWSSDRFKVTNLNIYSSFLPLKKMQDLTKGGKANCTKDGDFLGWGGTQWNLHGFATNESAPINRVCGNRDSMILFQRNFKSLSQCMQHCDRKVAGRVKTVSNKSRLEDVYRFLSGKIDGGREKVWMSVSDQEGKGEWRDVYTGRIVSYINVSATNASATHEKYFENFALQDAHSYYDLTRNSKCLGTKEKHCLCSLKTLRFRGLCQQAPIDSLYLPVRNDPDKVTYIGAFDSVIYHDNVFANKTTKKSSSNNWVITKMSDVILKSKDPIGESVFGKRLWIVQSESTFCDKEQNETIELKLTGCPDGRFTCNDGQCILSQKRCDHIADCRDESDEEDCKILVLRKSYRKSSPPISRGNNIENSNVPANININITLKDVSSIDEAENEIKIKFSMTMMWFERRAEYHNLKSDKSQNMIEEEDVPKIWTPNLVFQNSKNKEDTKGGLSKSKLLIQRLGNGIPSETDVVDEIEMFKGGENPIVTTQSFNFECQCNYNLLFFPFDTQVREKFQ